MLNSIHQYFQQLNNKLFLIALCCLAIVIRAFGVDPINLSIEEAEFFYYSQPSLSITELLAVCEKGLPVFDFLLYRSWFMIVGFSVLKGKLFSFLFNILLIPAVYALAKKIRNNETEARFSAFLVVVSLSLIALANTPRFYNEVLLFSVGSYYFFLDFLKPKTPFKSLVFYVLFTSLAILSYYFFAFILVSQGISICWFFLLKNKFL